jgi:hypothetical protein
MKELVIKQDTSGYNHFKTEGWVVILKNNTPVNFHADHGGIDTDYFCVNEIFRAMASSLQYLLEISEIIEVFNNTATFIYDTYKIDTVI